MLGGWGRYHRCGLEEHNVQLDSLERRFQAMDNVLLLLLVVQLILKRHQQVQRRAILSKEVVNVSNVVLDKNGHRTCKIRCYGCSTELVDPDCLS